MAKGRNDISKNTFAVIMNDTASTADEKKEALTQALVFDITQPEQSLTRLQEFLAFREHLDGERQRLAKEAASLSLGKLFSRDEKAAPPAQKPDAAAQQPYTAVPNLGKSVLDAFSAARQRSGEIIGNAAKAGQQLDAISKARSAVAGQYDLLQQASVEAARLNKEASEQLVACVTAYNGAMSEAFAVEPGVLQNMMTEGGRFIDQATKAVRPEAEAVRHELKRAGTAAARTAGMAVVKESVRILGNSKKGGPRK